MMLAPARRFCQLAAILLGLATIVGALAAHSLRPRLTDARYEVLQTAIYYQYFHSLGLLGVGVLLDRINASSLRVAGWLLFAGVLLFSGSLYLILAGAPRFVGVLTPIGGLSLIVAWGMAAWALGAPSTKGTP
jgi:uncharacterized membrane protein YgdD (TMEM256/DUF423 family)